MTYKELKARLAEYELADDIRNKIAARNNPIVYATIKLGESCGLPEWQRRQIECEALRAANKKLLGVILEMYQNQVTLFPVPANIIVAAMESRNDKGCAPDGA